MRRPVFFVLLLASLGYLAQSVDSSTPPAVQSASFAQQPAQSEANRKTAPRKKLTSNERVAFIRKAQIWQPTDIRNMNLRAGPGGAGAFEPNQAVTCDYADVPKGGGTQKFHCTLPNSDVVKVRYGSTNGEVQGSVLATRLLWALGFAADRVYPVRVTCRGCSSDPWSNRGASGQVTVFDPAVIERKPVGHEMWDNDKKSGWSWRELDLVDPSVGGAPPEQRDALKLLAVFMQHTDTKPVQQRLLCLPNGFSPNGNCEKPFLVLHDVGITFGHANIFNRDKGGSVNFEEWSTTPVWRNASACIGQLSKSRSGTLGDPQISEAGRKFLANLLVQLSDRQIRDLFEVAGVTRRTESNGKVSPASINSWVAVFNQKRNEIVSNHCAR